MVFGMDSIFVVFVGIHLYASTKRHLLHNFSSSAIRYNNVHPTMKGCPSPMDPFVKYRAPQQKRKLGRRPGRTRRRRVTFMSCPASAGAAETANGAMGLVRMVLLSLTAAYYTISAAVRCGRNPAPAQKAVEPIYIHLIPSACTIMHI